MKRGPKTPESWRAWRAGGLNPREPDEVPAELIPPADLPISARCHFVRLAATVRAEIAGVIRADAVIVAEIARAFADRDAAVATLAAQGGTVTGSRGQPVAHPATADKNTAELRIDRLLQTMGLSPKSRGPITVRPQPAPEPPKGKKGRRLRSMIQILDGGY